MACTSPLKAFFTLGSDGKKQISFYKFEKYGKSYDDCPDENKISIPCGKCLSCRLKYSSDWATRCVLESLKYKHNYFVTLTFDNDHLPITESSYVDKDTGEYFDGIFSASLDRSTMQKFMKDLRRYFKYHFDQEGIRFFGCGEYGPKNMRPHYHIILFNCDIPDLKLECTNFQGDNYYSSEILNKIWHHNGFVTIAECNYATCSYVARYMLKKQKGPAGEEFYGKLGLVRPFTFCSRDPGIARSYYDANSGHIYEYDSLVITGSDGVAKKVRPPAYFDKLYDIECPDDMKRIKENRLASAVVSMDQQLSNTDVDKEVYLSIKAENLEARCQKLVRLLD